MYRQIISKICQLDDGSKTVSKLVNNEGSESHRPTINLKLSKTVSDGPSKQNFLFSKNLYLLIFCNVFVQHGKTNLLELNRYCLENDSVFCCVCRHFPSSSKNSEDIFIKTGYCNWKNIREICKKHECSEAHKYYLTKYSSSYMSQQRSIAAKISQQF